ncbi:hypothetical protein KH5_18520 [Urechidicola sp. KH5]
MKKYYYVSIFLLLPLLIYSQESYKKYYKIKDQIYLKSVGNIPADTIYLKNKVTKKFDSLPEWKQNEINKSFKNRLGEIIVYSSKEVINGKDVEVYKTDTISKKYYTSKSYSYVDTILFNENDRKGFVLFEKNKIYVNPYLSGGKRSQTSVLNKDESKKLSNREDIYYYELKNRQTVRLKFQEGIVTALTIPLKYRFKDKENNIEEDFSTSFNVSLFAGYSWGTTSFFHRKKVGNKSNTWKFTLGAIIGTSTVTLDKSNTASNPLNDDESYTKGLISLGIGTTYVFNKINLGVFYGYDYAIGNYSERWDYNKKPWLGLGIGYSIFSL